MNLNGTMHAFIDQVASDRMVTFALAKNIVSQADLDACPIGECVGMCADSDEM